MKAFTGEVIGTFIMVLVGLATVASAAILEVYSGLFSVAALWGLGLVIAITISSPLSGAHLNPAITLAFATTTDFSWQKVPAYFLAQALGAFTAAAVVYGLYGSAIGEYEQVHNILRGSPQSVRTAMVFGEYFPNPAAGTAPITQTDMGTAFLAEALGTGFLSFVIFSLIKLKGLPAWLIPLLIGGTLTVLISLLAPLSMAGFNPVRDLIPRLFSSLVGWGSVPFTHNGMGWLLVYIIAPVIGAQIGAVLSRISVPQGFCLA